nr:carbon-phosphorus lyase complex subunit PhnI [Klebsiella pneumoniae subsp. pneumoniae]
MSYVAVKGGEKAIRAAHALQEQKRRGDGRLPELSVEQIGDQLSLAVDRVMTEGGIADRELAALALKQASGDNVEAIFLLRAYRTTLPRLAVSEPIPRRCASNAASPQCIKISPAASCWAPLTTTPTACSILPCWPTAKRRLCSKPMAKQSRRRTSLPAHAAGAGEDRGRSHAARRYHPHPAGLPLLAFLAPAAADARR